MYPLKQGSLHYQPKQCIIIRKIPQIYHKFLLFDSPKIGNLMTPVKGIVVEDIQYCNANDLPKHREFMLHSELLGLFFFWGGGGESEKPQVL